MTERGRGQGRGDAGSASRPSLGVPPPRRSLAGLSDGRYIPARSSAAAATENSAATLVPRVTPRNASSASFIEKVRLLSQEPRFVDFTIICDEAAYKVSRLVISAHSAYFKRVCIGAFKEGLEGKITLQEDEPAAVRAMIQFFQENDYDCSASDPLLLHIEVFTIADKYEVTELKDVALKHFTSTLLDVPGKDKVKALLSITGQVFGPARADGRLRQTLLRQWRAPGVVPSSMSELENLVGDYPAFGAELIKAWATPEKVHLVEKFRPATDAEMLVYRCLKAMPGGTTIFLPDIARKTGLSDADVRSGLKALTHFKVLNEVGRDSWQWAQGSTP